MPVPTLGHTSGHCAFHLPERGVLITGDALITAHPIARTTCPQLCPPMFNHNEAATLAALQALAGLPADVVLPGTGRSTAAAHLALSSWPWPRTAERHRTGVSAVAARVRVTRTGTW